MALGLSGECVNTSTESHMNVNSVKSILQNIYSSTDSQRCLHLLQGPTLQVPIKSLFLNGLHVLQKMSSPSSAIWSSSFTETQDHICDIVSHVTAEFICELLRSCFSSDPAEAYNKVNELNLVLSSLTPVSESTPTVLPTRKTCHDSFSTCLEENDEFVNQGATTDSASESELIVFEEVKKETLGNWNDKTNRPFIRQHCYEFTKNIPAAIALCRRGVRCKICFYLYKGPTCVDRLVEHTKAKHPHRASPKQLNQLRQNNSLQKIVGDGMRICRCQMCTYIGPGSLRT